MAINMTCRQDWRVHYWFWIAIVAHLLPTGNQDLYNIYNIANIRLIKLCVVSNRCADYNISTSNKSLALYILRETKSRRIFCSFMYSFNSIFINTYQLFSKASKKTLIVNYSVALRLLNWLTLFNEHFSQKKNK